MTAARDRFPNLTGTPFPDGEKINKMRFLRLLDSDRGDPFVSRSKIINLNAKRHFSRFIRLRGYCYDFCREVSRSIKICQRLKLFFAEILFF